MVGVRAGELSAAARAAHAQLPWDRLVRMRSFLTDYDKVRPEDVWASAMNDIPPLLTDLDKIIAAEQQDSQSQS